MAAVALYMGVDGGATKTIGLVADAERNIVARQRVGATNPNFAGLEGATIELARLIRLCCREAGCSTADLRAVVMGLAGAGDEPNRRRIRKAVNTLLRRNGKRPIPIDVQNDARVALEGAFDGREGIVVVAGTGSNVMGKSPSGQIVNAGGWGRVFGDEGSGYMIGAEALRAVARDFDGRGVARVLRRMLRERFGWESGEWVVEAVYRRSFNVPSLAPLVFEAAELRDPVSRTILQSNAALLAEQVAVVVRRLGPPHHLGVVFTGSLINHDTIYAGMLRHEIQLRCPGAEFPQALHPPAYGALLMAEEGVRRKR